MKTDDLLKVKIAVEVELRHLSFSAYNTKRLEIPQLGVDLPSPPPIIMYWLNGVIPWFSFNYYRGSLNMIVICNVAQVRCTQVSL